MVTALGDIPGAGTRRARPPGRKSGSAAEGLALYNRFVYALALTLPPWELNQVRHHAVLGHGLAVQAIRASGRAGTKGAPAAAE